MRVEIPHGIGLKDARAILSAWQSAGIKHLIPEYPGLPIALADIELHKPRFTGTGKPARMARGKYAVRSRRMKQQGARYLRKRRKEIEE